MTVLESIVNKIISYKYKLNDTKSKIIELGYELEGVEIKYKGNFAVVSYADVLNDDITLYIEDDNGCSWNETISIFELEELIK